MSLSSCSSWHFSKKVDLFSGACFDIYQCGQCKRRYCFHCSGSNGARKCQNCASSSRQTFDRVYVKQASIGR